MKNIQRFNMEIGGYFGLEQTIKINNGEYYPSLIALNTARNALVYIARARQIKRLYIPFYLCDSVSGVCDREGIDYSFYHIGKDFLPLFDIALGTDEYLYVVNYYGQLDNNQLFFLKNKYQRIIVDNVQAFFQPPLRGVDTIYSCRKWFGVPDGAYLSTNCFLKEELDVDNSDGRTKHLIGRIKDGAFAHYSEFKENDDFFKTLKLMSMSRFTHELLNNIDYKKIIDSRNDNFSFLHSKLKSINKLSLKAISGPFFYPLYVDNGEKIRKYLIDNNIYVPILWPNVINVKESDYAKNIIPIPCDQRYSKEEMLFISSLIFSIINSSNE